MIERVKNFNILLLFIVVLALFLRFHSLGEKSLSIDEAFAHFRAKQDLSVLFEMTKTGPAGGISLDYYTSHLSLMMGDNEFFMRLTSALWGVLAIYMIFLWGRNLGGRRVGLFASFLLSISLYHIYYSQEGRAYSAFLTMTLVCTLFLMRFLKKRNVLSALIYGGSVLILLLEYLMGIVVIFLHVGFLLYVFTALGHKKDKESNEDMLTLRDVFLLFKVLLVTLLILSPFYLLNLNQVQDKYFNIIVGRPYSISFSSITRILLYFSSGSIVLFYPLLGLFFLGLVSTLKNPARRYYGLLSVLFLLVPYPTTVFFANKFEHNFSARYIISSLPFYLTFIAMGVEAIFLFVKRHSARVLSTTWVIIFLIFVTICSYSPIKWYLDHEVKLTDGLDLKSSSEWLKENMRDGDIVFFDPAQSIFSRFYYYWEMYNERLMGRSGGVIVPYYFERFFQRIPHGTRIGLSRTITPPWFSDLKFEGDVWWVFLFLKPEFYRNEDIDRWWVDHETNRNEQQERFISQMGEYFEFENFTGISVGRAKEQVSSIDDLINLAGNVSGRYYHIYRAGKDGLGAYFLVQYLLFLERLEDWERRSDFLDDFQILRTEEVRSFIKELNSRN